MALGYIISQDMSVTVLYLSIIKETS